MNCPRCRHDNPPALKFSLERYEGTVNLAMGRVFARSGELDPARERLAIAAAMFGDTGMRFWLEQAQPELERLG